MHVPLPPLLARAIARVLPSAHSLQPQQHQARNREAASNNVSACKSHAMLLRQISRRLSSTASCSDITQRFQSTAASALAGRLRDGPDLADFIRSAEPTAVSGFEPVRACFIECCVKRA